MDKSQKIWVNELYLLKFTVCRLTDRVRKLENFVAYSLDNVLANIEEKIKLLEVKAFSSLSDKYNSNNLPHQPLPKAEVKIEENLSQINHETIVPSPFIDDLHGMCSTIKDSDVLTLAESLAEFEPIINDPEALAYYSLGALGGETDRSVFEIMDYEAAQQLLLAPLITEVDMMQQPKPLLVNNSEVLTPTNHPVNPNCSNTINPNEDMSMLIDFQLPSPSHEVEIADYIEVSVSEDVVPLNSTCEGLNRIPLVGNSDIINASELDVKANHIPVLPPVKSSCKKEKPSASLKKHIKNGKSTPPDVEIVDGAFLCSQCGKQFTTMANLKRHAHSHEKKVFYPCSKCKRRYESESRLNRHKADKHPPDFYCEYCKLEFDNPFAFTNHRLNVHPGEY